VVTDLDCVADRTRAAELLRPIRLEILRLARDPISATELASRLGLPRQRVNYHVRQLARHGFLRRAGRRRRRNMIEQRFAASARGLLLSPELLGAVAADWREIPDAASAAYLLALSGEMESDVARASREAAKGGRRLSTLSFKSQFRFATPEQREGFTHALRDALTEVIARHTSAYRRPDGSEAPGTPYRLVLGSYPYTP
jgi:DNA-binding transcriptional ArsR family regulator